ncbi:MAG TPA: hypothetical protein VHR45_09560 [Thermoanaerobaculia bacterium]|nr:hypothetical protein [Thermoanaerobaculia bacterium]
MNRPLSDRGARARDETIATDRQPPSRLWWIYFLCLLALAALGAKSYLALLLRPDRQEHDLLIGAAASALNAWGLLGLWCYIRSKPLGFSWIWKLCLVLTADQLAFAAYLFGKTFMMVAPYESLFPVRGERVVSLLGLCGILFAIPLLIALWRYAFRSPELWRS